MSQEARAVRTITILIAFWLCACSSALAQLRDNLFPPLDGWTHGAAFNSGDSPELHGVLIEGKAPAYTSPVVAEIDGNSENGLEVSVVGADAALHVLSSSGQVLWETQLPIGNCGGSSNRSGSSPAVGTILGNGVPYVVVGYGGIGQSQCDGGVAAYRGSDGALLWNFSLKKFHRQRRMGEKFSAVWSTPALADTDGDGRMEIGFGSFDRNVYLLNGDGSVRWYYHAADTVWSSAAFADINDDGRKELIVGTDISANKYLRPPTQNGGYVYALDTRARRSKQIGFRSDYIWMTAFDQVIWSPPVVADVLPDVPGPEVIVQSGYYFSPKSKGQWIKILNGRTGSVLRTLAAPSASAGSVAVADLNDDGLLDIVAAISGAGRYGGAGKGVVMAWSPALGNAPLWAVYPLDRGNSPTFMFHAPIVADLDGNGSLEVAVDSGASIVVFQGTDGAQLTCGDESCADGRKSLFAFGTLGAAPAAADLNRDGILDLVAAGTHRGTRKGTVKTWTALDDLHSEPGTQPPYSAPWPMARGNAGRSGAP